MVTRAEMVQLIVRYDHSITYVSNLYASKYISPEDLKQEAILKLLTGGLNYNPTKFAFSTYAGTVIKNASIDIMRKAKKRKDINVKLTDDLYNNIPKVTHKENYFDTEVIEGYMETTLNKKERIIINKRKHGLSYGEIAEELSLPIGSIKATIHRARAKTKHLLETLNRMPQSPIK